jgi:hypothetical protein
MSTTKQHLNGTELECDAQELRPDGSCAKCERINERISRLIGKAIAEVKGDCEQMHSEASQEIAQLREVLQGFVDAAPSNGNRCLYCDAAIYGGNDTDEHSPDCEIERGRKALDKAKGVGDVNL